MMDSSTGFVVIYVFIIVIGACIILALAKEANSG